MPFTLIKGTFHAKGYSPDGDSLRFKANNIANWKKLAGPKVELNGRKHAQLRFEGVDALETHYRAGGTPTHQPIDLARQATDFTLKTVGITQVKWGPKHRRVTQANDGKPGYILTRTTERYRRPVAFVFSGTINRQDGASLRLDARWLRRSLNHKLCATGNAYPTYYHGLYWDLREALTLAVISASNAGHGVWPYDWTSGVRVDGLRTLQEDCPVMPKLFRRLADYLSQNGDDISGFKAYIASQETPILVLPQGQVTHFDTVIRQDGKTVGLEVEPEQLVFFD